MNKRIVATVLGAAVLAVPAAAIADSGHGKGAEKTAAKNETKTKGRKAKKVMLVFKGTFAAPGTVEVLSGNAHVRKGGFVGHQVSFDFASARVVAADTNADQKVDLTDVKDGDLVLVQARAAKGTRYGAPAAGEVATAIVARKLIDATNAPADDDGPAPAP
jgi:dihydroxyacid dehydratase/phosphogluconate dehydratase